MRKNSPIKEKILFIALITVMVISIMHSKRQWKHLHAAADRIEQLQNCKQCELRSLIEYPENGEIE